MEQLGNQIKKIRELKNLTQSHVAGKLGMSQSNYARIENNHVKITDNQLSIIANVLDTNTSIIKQIDERLNIGLTVTEEFKPNPQMILHFYKNLKELYTEEIMLLEKKVKLLETISG